MALKTMDIIAQERHPEGDKEEIGNQLILDLMILDFRFQPHKADALTTRRSKILKLPSSWVLL
ncbi:MAG: hypothetical protein ACLUDU_15480 [Butyricimonas faecihominis]